MKRPKNYLWTFCWRKRGESDLKLEPVYRAQTFSSKVSAERWLARRGAWVHAAAKAENRIVRICRFSITRGQS